MLDPASPRNFSYEFAEEQEPKPEQPSCCYFQRFGKRYVLASVLLYAIAIALLYYFRGTRHLWIWAVSLAALLALLPCIEFTIRRRFSTSVARILETVDRTMLGADLSMEYIDLDTYEGKVLFKEFTLENPLGDEFQWQSPFLLFAEEIEADISWWHWFMSCGRLVVVEKLVVKGVELVIEKTLTTSNLGEIIHRLESFFKKVGLRVANPHNDAHAEDPHRQDSSGTRLVFHTIAIQDVAVKLKQNVILETEIDVMAADMLYDDFAKEVPHPDVRIVIGLLLKTLLKSIASNLVGLDAMREMAGYHPGSPRSNGNPASNAKWGRSCEF